jgi:hypothetical protein
MIHQKQNLNVNEPVCIMYINNFLWVIFVFVLGAPGGAGAARGMWKRFFKMILLI